VVAVNISETRASARIAQPLWTDRRRIDHFVLPTLLRTLDLLVLLVAAALTLWTSVMADGEAAQRNLMGAVVVAALYLGRANAIRLYDIGAIMRPISRLDDILITLGLACGGTAAIILGLGVTGSFDPLVGLRFAVTGFVLLAVMRIGVFKLLERLSRRGLIGRNLVVLGTGEQGRRFLKRFAAARPYFTILQGVFDDRLCGEETGRRGDPEADIFADHPLLGGIDDLLRYARQLKIDDVVIAMPWNADQRVLDMVERLKELPVHVYLSTDLVGYELSFSPALGHSAALPLFEVAQRPISGWSAALKTVEDYVLAGVALVLISPLLAIIAVAIKIDSPGPVFFMQERLGFNNKPFAIYKFRSMYHQRIPETVVRQAQKGDPRVTRVGRFIRATSLDELPQLLNVLNGTMSLVGPRPHALSHNEEYGRQIRGYFARHKVKPGITGWAQVNGLRGETEALELMEARVRHDVYYAENWSLFLDIRILIMTVLVVFFQKTAY